MKTPPTVHLISYQTKNGFWLNVVSADGKTSIPLMFCAQEDQRAQMRQIADLIVMEIVGAFTYKPAGL